MLGPNGEFYTDILLYSLGAMGILKSTRGSYQVPIHRMKNQRQRKVTQEREIVESERAERCKKESRMDPRKIQGRNSTNPCWFIVLLMLLPDVKV